MIRLVVALVLLVAGPAAAQDWVEYVSTQDRFAVAFPGQPTITEITWTSQLDYTLPGRVYSVEANGERYSVTVVDYTSLEEQGIARAATCPPGNAQCREDGGPLLGAGYWMHDERGAIVYATFKLLQRDATLTSLSWEWQDRVEGHIVHLTNNADQSRTSAYIAMHERKLYIVEATVPRGQPEPGAFYQTVGWIDEAGNRIRYETVYSNSFHGLGIYPVPANIGPGRGSADPAGVAR